MLEKIIRKSVIISSVLTNLIACSDTSSPNTSSQPDSTFHYSIDSILTNKSDTETYDICNKKTYFPDKDGDGFGVKEGNIHACVKPESYVDTFPFDCNDDNKKVYPGAKEECNGVDDNCNGVTDEDIPVGYCKTACGEGQIICKDGKMQECTTQPKQELCDCLDNNCNGITDENVEITTKYYKDNDGDGFGDYNDYILSCCPKEGYVKIPGDCNDNDINIHPGAEEICNGKDDNCDGLIDKKYNIKSCLSYDFIFVIDNSGSMGWNDKNNNRYKGLKEVVNVLWENDDRGLMVPFGDKYEIINSFTSNKSELSQNIDTAQSCKTCGWGTMIGPAVQAGINQYEQNSQKRVLFLLTDGDTGDIISPTSLNQLATKNNVEICAFGLGDANGSYLNTLTTGIGDYQKIYSANDIPKFFINSYLSIKCSTYEECSTSKKWIEKKKKTICGI